MESVSTDQTVGLIGAGLLGAAMAERWLRAGWHVLGYDVDADRLAALVAAGGTRAASAADVLAGCSRVVLSLPDSTIVRQVIEPLEGRLSPGQLIVDTTTGDPSDAVSLAERLVPRQVDWLDSTVAGSSQQMRQGEAVLLVGGTESAFARARSLLAALSDHVYWLGACGSGARMKLVVNLAIGLHRAALAEALALARAFGFDLAQTLEVLQATPAYSRAMETKGWKMVEGDFTPQARLAQHLKDVELMLQAGHQHQQPLPLTELHRRILQACVERGDGGLDNSAVIREWFRETSRG